ncbi:MAG: hypothetical protein INH41_25425 [Myxococcaceae bacterium]|nr:hypothetical protein [Myxococcaceae bacterium]MCA3015741.1 hypothetical protein [Myxococcaceae bacterium]
MRARPLRRPRDQARTERFIGNEAKTMTEDDSFSDLEAREKATALVPIHAPDGGDDGSPSDEDLSDEALPGAADD